MYKEELDVVGRLIHDIKFIQVKINIGYCFLFSQDAEQYRLGKTKIFFRAGQV